MRQHSGSRLGLVVAVGIALCATTSRAMVTAEDQKLIDEAGCEEIVKEYRKHVAAEKAVADEIRQSSSSTTKSNAIGLASMAILGIGFFSWNDNSDAETNLAELRAYREAIAAAGRKKNCAL